MRIALAQLNPTVGDIAGNTRLILEAIDQAKQQNADLVVFPELAVIGYPPKDLLLKPSIIEQCGKAVEHIAQHCTGIAAIIGYPAPSDQKTGRPLYNAAAVCRDGKLLHRHVKSLLPTYDVFDEHRYFEPGEPTDLTDFDGVKLGISVCEDLWNDEELFSRQLYHDNPISWLAEQGAELFINCSASPFFVRKREFRSKLLQHAAQRYGLPVIYVNQVGGNDELIFDGHSCVFDATGKMITQLKGFEPDLVTVELDCAAAQSGDAPCVGRPGPIVPAREGMAELYEALVLGVRDYCRKCGFESIVLGLSGGIDSAVTAAIAVGALGPGKVRGITMPSRYSSEGSKTDAQFLAERLGITFHTIPIEQPHKALEQLIEPHFQGLAPDTTEENIQARVRGIILMAFSNKFGSLLVTTGNKSEMAVGYCTLYGDMAGGLAVLSDVPKTMVYELAEWINTDECPLFGVSGQPPIPRDTITKPPSAELRPDQKDEDSLPPYAVLDEIIQRYVERDQSVKQILEETGFEPQIVHRWVAAIDRNEYKRKQSPPGLKVTGKAFGFGRRMPIAMRHDPTGNNLRDLLG
jgi:NAD+ synthetase